jgi:hypothetical protein
MSYQLNDYTPDNGAGMRLTLDLYFKHTFQGRVSYESLLRFQYMQRMHIFSMIWQPALGFFNRYRDRLCSKLEVEGLPS